MEFYSPAGLKTIALLLDNLLEDSKSLSQNALAEAVGVASNTIKGVRSNRLVTDKILYEPNPTTLLNLAPFVMNPLTAKPFDPEDFLKVARGQIIIPPEVANQDGEVDRLSSSPAVALIRSKMEEQGKSKKKLAIDCGLPLKALEEILDGRRPTWIELLKLGGGLFEDKNPEPLARLLGVDVDAPVQQSDSVSSNKR